MRDWTSVVEMARRELMDGRDTAEVENWQEKGRFDNLEYKISHKSVYHSYLVLLEIVKICRPPIDAKKLGFLPI